MRITFPGFMNSEAKKEDIASITRLHINNTPTLGLSLNVNIVVESFALAQCETIQCTVVSFIILLLLLFHKTYFTTVYFVPNNNRSIFSILFLSNKNF